MWIRNNNEHIKRSRSCSTDHTGPQGKTPCPYPETTPQTRQQGSTARIIRQTALELGPRRRIVLLPGPNTKMSLVVAKDIPWRDQVPRLPGHLAFPLFYSPRRCLLAGLSILPTMVNRTRFRIPEHGMRAFPVLTLSRRLADWDTFHPSCNPPVVAPSSRSLPLKVKGLVPVEDTNPTSPTATCNGTLRTPFSSCPKAVTVKALTPLPSRRAPGGPRFLGQTPSQRFFPHFPTWVSALSYRPHRRLFQSFRGISWLKHRLMGTAAALHPEERQVWQHPTNIPPRSLPPVRTCQGP